MVSAMVIFVVLLLAFPMTVFAADALYRLMHNDHDALIIGKIIKVEGNIITVHVIKTITSAKDLHADAPKKQLIIKLANITGVTGYAFYYKNIEIPMIIPQAGDYVLASITRKNYVFSVAWGLYKVDRTDFRTLSILYPDSASLYAKMDAAAIKAFINSGGKLTEFAFDGNTGKVISQADGRVIFDGRKVSSDSLRSTPVGPSTSSDNLCKRITVIIVITAATIISLVLLIKKQK